jgi:hypothetical protein
MVGVAARRSIEQIEKTPAIRPLIDPANFIQRKKHRSQMQEGQATVA